MIRELKRSREALASASAIASLVLGILVTAFVNKQIGISDGVTMVALLLIPLVVYGLVSGRLMELTGPGGLGIKFKETASEPLETSDVLGPDASLRLSPEDMMFIAKGALGMMQQQIMESIPRGGPRALTMRIKEGYHYDYGTVRSALETLSRLPGFKFIVVLDEGDRLISYAPLWTFGDFMNFEPSPNLLSLFQLVQDINEGRKDSVSTYPGIKKETASIHSSNTEALEKMERLNLEAIAVVDEMNRFKGVVERDRILSQMMVALAKGARGREAR